LTHTVIARFLEPLALSLFFLVYTPYVLFEDFVSSMTRGSRSRLWSGRNPAQPRQHVTTLRHRWTVRWTVGNTLGTQANPATISYQNIGDILNVGTLAGGASAAQIFDAAVRVRRVSIWGAPSATGLATSCAVDFQGVTVGSAGDSVRFEDTAVGTAQGPVVHAIPPKNSSAGFWQSSGLTNIAFSIYCLTGSVVELDYEGTATEQNATRAVGAAPVGVTSGASYVRGLDGAATAGSAFITVGYAQD